MRTDNSRVYFGLVLARVPGSLVGWGLGAVVGLLLKDVAKAFGSSMFYFLFYFIFFNESTTEEKIMTKVSFLGLKTSQSWVPFPILKVNCSD